jgi:hypothetical protein
MTGRGLGYCSGYDAPGFTFGRGFGRGRGFRSFVPAAPAAPARPVQLSEAEQIKVLESQKDALKDELGALEGKLKELKRSAKAKKA